MAEIIGLHPACRRKTKWTGRGLFEDKMGKMEYWLRQTGGCWFPSLGYLSDAVYPGDGYHPDWREAVAKFDLMCERESASWH